MTYTAPTANAWRKKPGTPAKKITDELILLDAEMDVHKIKEVIITAGMGTTTALATTGVDLANAATTTYYGVFVAPEALTLVSMYDYITEAYVKETADAKIEIWDDAGTPVKRFGRTLTAGGEAAKNVTTTEPETGYTAVTAGTRLDLKITGTNDSTGTGHAVVVLRYRLD